MKNERILLLTLAAINFTSIMDFMVMMPLGPQLMRTFHINPQGFGLIVSSYTISAGISGFFCTFIIDRFDRKSSLMVAYTGFLIGTFLCGLVPDFNTLLIARVFTGIFGGTLGAIALSIIADLVPMERRGTAMGILMAGFSVASVFGVPFGLHLATLNDKYFSKAKGQEELFFTNLGDWHAPFLFLGLIGLVIWFVILRVIPSVNKHIQEKHERPSPFALMKEIFSDRNQVKALLLMVALMFGHFCIVPFISPYMVSNVGFSESDLKLIYLVGGICTIFSSPLIGRLSDKIGKLRVFTIFVILCCAPIIGITNMGPMPLTYALTVTSLFFIFSGGRFIPAQAMVTGAVNPKTRGSFMSFSSAMQQFTAGIASIVAGMMVTKNATGQLSGYNYVGYLAAAITLVTILIARSIKVKPEKEITVEPSNTTANELQEA